MTVEFVARAERERGDVETMDPVTASVAAAGVGGTLFGYNRKSFFFDGEMRRERLFKTMDIRIKRSDCLCTLRSFTC